MGPALRMLVAAVAAAAAVACAARAPAPSEPSDPRLHKYSLNDGTLLVELRIPESPPGRKPVVLSPFSDPEALLARGVIVASYQIDWKRTAELLGVKEPAPQPETEPEGQRVGAWLLSSPRPGVIGRAYFGLIAANAERSVPAVVSFLVAQPDVDPARIAIAGSSTQGFVALEALQHEPRLAAGLVRVACGDYFAFLRSSTLALADDPRWLPDGHMQLDADYEAELHAHQPIDRADAYPPRPLLLLAGREDRVMPVACVESTERSLEAAYTRAGVADHLRVDVLDGAGHDLGAGSDALVLEWLDRWLLPASASN